MLKCKICGETVEEVDGVISCNDCGTLERDETFEDNGGTVVQCEDCGDYCVNVMADSPEYLDHPLCLDCFNEQFEMIQDELRERQEEFRIFNHVQETMNFNKRMGI
jgi:DNA-directed RNA polymerase subunit RPC12/RpoP